MLAKGRPSCDVGVIQVSKLCSKAEISFTHECRSGVRRACVHFASSDIEAGEGEV